MAEDDGPTLPPEMFAKQLEQMQEAGEQVSEQQLELFEQMLSASSGGQSSGFPGLPGMDLGAFGPLGAGVFKTRVQSGGRISIPDAERDALGIEEGDIVQTVVIPVKQGNSE